MTIFDDGMESAQSYQECVSGEKIVVGGKEAIADVDVVEQEDARIHGGIKVRIAFRIHVSREYSWMKDGDKVVVRGKKGRLGLRGDLGGGGFSFLVTEENRSSGRIPGA